MDKGASLEDQKGRNKGSDALKSALFTLTYVVDGQEFAREAERTLKRDSRANLICFLFVLHLRDEETEEADEDEYGEET